MQAISHFTYNQIFGHCRNIWVGSPMRVEHASWHKRTVVRINRHFMKAHATAIVFAVLALLQPLEDAKLSQVLPYCWLLPSGHLENVAEPTSTETYSFLHVLCIRPTADRWDRQLCTSNCSDPR